MAMVRIVDALALTYVNAWSVAPASLPVEKDFATRNYLLATVVVGNVPSQQDKPRFRCLQIQSAVMQAAQLLVALVALQATKHAIQNSSAAKDVGIGR